MSTLRVNTLQDVSGTGQPTMPGAAKAWVNFNGTGTVSIRAAFNVSSIEDNGVGDYTVNFTNAMPDANYVVQATGSSINGNNTVRGFSVDATNTPTASAVRLQHREPAVKEDCLYGNIAIYC